MLIGGEISGGGGETSRELAGFVESMGGVGLAIIGGFDCAGRALGLVKVF